MYNNIGGKIKVLAHIIAGIGIFVSIISGTPWVYQGANAPRHGGGEILIALGLGIIIVGSLYSWIFSFFIYGFGELIEKTAEIASDADDCRNLLWRIEQKIGE